MGAVGVHVPAGGSYSSAVVLSELVPPPTTRTLPSGNKVAVCHSRGIVSGLFVVNAAADSDWIVLHASVNAARSATDIRISSSLFVSFAKRSGPSPTRRMTCVTFADGWKRAIRFYSGETL